MASVRALLALCLLPAGSAMIKRELLELSARSSESTAARTRAQAWQARLASLRGCSGLECMQQYVALEDDAYTWSDSGHVTKGTDASNGVGYTSYVLNMTSQHWLSPKETSASIWWHPLVVVIPDNLEAQSSDWATLVVGGAMATNDLFKLSPPSATNLDVLASINMATRTKAPAATLLMVPNQDMVLPEVDGKRRSEDGIKAYTWMEAREHPDEPTWPIEMPSAKAVVRAMDTVTAFAETLQLPRGATSKYVVTGCSKRGMATYDVAAADTVPGRVKAIMPCVVAWNTTALATVGGPSFGAIPHALHDYLESGFDRSFDDPSFEPVLDIIDPMRWTTTSMYAGLPKFVLNAGNDDIFLPDSTNQYWDHLPEPKTLLVAPNLPHQGSLGLDNFVPAAANFVRGILRDAALPQINWTLDKAAGTIAAYQVSGHTPVSVEQWTASTCAGSGRRDFRQMTAESGENCTRCGHEDPSQLLLRKMAGVYAPPAICVVTAATAYAATPVAESAPASGTWTAKIEAPGDGQWSSSLLLFTYAPLEDGLAPFTISTEALVYPDVYPFPSCTGVGCEYGGKIV